MVDVGEMKSVGDEEVCFFSWALSDLRRAILVLLGGEDVLYAILEGWWISTEVSGDVWPMSPESDGAVESKDSLEKTGEGLAEDASETASAAFTAALWIPRRILSNPSTPVRLSFSLSGKAR